MLGRPLLARTLDALVAAGCEAVAINLHHLAAAIPAALGEAFRGVPLVYSREQPILGTAGAFGPLRDFFAGGEPLLLVNGDSLCRWPLAALLAQHRRRGAPVTLLLAGRPHPRSFGGGVGIDRRGRVTALRGEPRFGLVARHFVFAGAYAMDPALLQRVPPGVSDSMADLFPALLAAGGTIESWVTWRRWHDLGTPGRYLDGVLETARRETGGSWRAEDAKVDADARVRAAVLEPGVVVEAGARVEASLLLDAATVGQETRLLRVVVGPGVEVPPHGSWRECLLTRWRPAARVPPGSRRDGHLVVTPLAASTAVPA